MTMGEKHLERTRREKLSVEMTFHQTWVWEKRQRAMQRAEERTFQAEETARAKVLRLKVRARHSKNSRLGPLATFRTLNSIPEILPFQILYH